MPTPRADRNSLPAGRTRGGKRPRAPVFRLLVGLAALATIAVALGHLLGVRAGLGIETEMVDGTPVTVFRAAPIRRGPVVVIAHGFAGSQQLMQPFAITLAHSGMVAVSFDFPGHGRNPARLPGGLVNDTARTGALLESLARVVAFARTLPETDGRVALLGHSMAVEVLTRYALAHPETVATVAISGFAPGVDAAHPSDLLALVGALEPPPLRDEAIRMAGGPGHEARHGRFEDGRARAAVLAPGVEHIGVLYSATSLRAARDWLCAAFGLPGSDFVDQRGPWLGLLFAGIVALGWPLARLLPVVADPPRGGGLRWVRLLPVALLPALATPVILRFAPTDFLPILLGDYLAVHFALYGGLTAGCWWLLRPADGRGGRTNPWLFAAATVVLSAWCIVALGTPIDAFATSFVANVPRLPLVAALFLGTLPYFVADEWATRGPGAAWGGYAFTKLCFALSLALAIGLDVRRLFFLIIIVPVIVLFLIIYGLFSAWAFRRTGQPLVAAVANALAFAWAIAVVFPLTSR